MSHNDPPMPEPRESRGTLAFAVAEFNPEITHEMLRQAQERAEALGFTVGPVARVNGSWDLPFVVDRLLTRAAVTACVAIGTIVTGATKHDEVIGHAVSKSLLDVSLARGKPVGFGVTGPGQDYTAAKARINRAAHAVDAVARSLDAVSSGGA